MATALTSEYTRFTDKCNKVLAGGIVKTFEPNSLTPKISYQDPNKEIPNLTEVRLDETGRAKIYIDGDYRIQVYSRDGVLIEDNLLVEQSLVQRDFVDLSQSLQIEQQEKLNQFQAQANEVIAQGFYKGFTTETLLLAAKPVVAEMRARADDTRKIWRWNRTSGEGVVPVTGTWTDTGLSDLDRSMNYTSERAEELKNFVAQKLYVNLDKDLHQFADVEGNIVARIDQYGMLHVVGLENPIQMEFTEQKSEILEAVDSTVSIIQKSLNILTDQPDLHIFTDVDGYIVAKISHDGQLHVVGLNQPVQIEFVTLNEKVGAVSESVNRRNYGTDDLYLVTDLDGNILARIKEDGRYYIVGLSNDIATEFESVRDEINRKSESIKDTSIAEKRSYKDTVTAQVQTVLNTLMYAQTGAKAPAPLHYFPQNYTINKTWISQINQFGHSNSERLTIASPYHEDGGICHPHILEFYNGFRGYRYIVAITPYHLTNEAEENPCIYGTNDLISFDLLDGFEQPLDVRPTPAYSNGHNSDNVLAYDPRTGELICIWRQTLRNPNNDGVRVDALWMRKTKDGYNWTERERIFKATDHALAKGAGSPAIVYDVASGYWYMYLTTLSLTTDAMRLFKAKSLKEDAWEYAGTLVLPFKPWHQDIKIVGNKVCMLVYCYPPDNTIYFGIADDFINFEWTQNLLLENNGYKSSFVPEFNEQNQMALKILYSTDASPDEASEKWRMYMHQTNFINVNLELI